MASSTLDTDCYYEIVGRVDASGDSVNEMSCTGFGDRMDIGAYDKMLIISQSYPDLFGW